VSDLMYMGAEFDGLGDTVASLCPAGQAMYNIFKPNGSFNNRKCAFPTELAMIKGMGWSATLAPAGSVPQVAGSVAVIPAGATVLPVAIEQSFLQRYGIFLLLGGGVAGYFGWRYWRQASGEKKRRAR